MKLLIYLFSLFSLHANEGFIHLFDGSTLDQWTAAKATEKKPYGEFSINEEEKSIHVYAGEEAGSKQATDCLVSKQQFSHFILKMEYKWLEKRFAPRVDWDRDAGLLFHVHGDLKKVWPYSVEMQMGETPADVFDKGWKRFHTGDLFVLGKHLRASFLAKDSKWDMENGEKTSGRHVKTTLGVEKPKGQWNEMEIQVHGAEKAVFILNGETVLEIYDMEQQNEEGEWVPLEKGHIGLQAEWAELLYRNIRVKELPQD